jgi:hypothetical protein
MGAQTGGDKLDEHLTTVVAALANSEVVPFLGAGANLCGRPAGQAFELGKYLPSGSELANYLAEQSRFLTYKEEDVECPHCHQTHKVQYPLTDMHDLLRVAQYVTVLRGAGPLYKQLHHIFDADYPPTALHSFLATLPSVLRDKRHPSYPLIVTTNYDDVLEHAFWNAREPLDLVYYIAVGRDRGKFTHSLLDPAAATDPSVWPPKVEPILISKPNEYSDLSLKHRAAILKIHGAVARASAEQSSFVISEDHYIDYLTRTDISNLLPVKLAEKLRNSNFLFLGYSLRDWNLRVILHRIWGDQQLNYTSWAVQFHPQDLDERFWKRRDVEIIDADLEHYIEALSKRVQTLPAAPG